MAKDAYLSDYHSYSSNRNWPFNLETIVNIKNPIKLEITSL